VLLVHMQQPVSSQQQPPSNLKSQAAVPLNVTAMKWWIVLCHRIASNAGIVHACSACNEFASHMAMAWHGMQCYERSMSANNSNI
jgi:hypothetical protein